MNTDNSAKQQWEKILFSANKAKTSLRWITKSITHCFNKETCPYMHTKARLHRRFLSRQLDAIFVAPKSHQVSNMFETPAISRRQIAVKIAPGLHVRFWSCNLSATKIASSCCEKNRRCKRALTQTRIEHTIKLGLQSFWRCATGFLPVNSTGLSNSTASSLLISWRYSIKFVTVIYLSIPIYSIYLFTWFLIMIYFSEFYYNVMYL